MDLKPIDFTPNKLKEVNKSEVNATANANMDSLQGKPCSRPLKTAGAFLGVPSPLQEVEQNSKRRWTMQDLFDDAIHKKIELDGGCGSTLSL